MTQKIEKLPSEWIGAVNLSARANPQWQVHTYLPAYQLGELGHKISHKRLWDRVSMRTKLFSKNSDRIFAIFHLRPNFVMKDGAMKEHRVVRKLIETLEDKGYPIIWKENGMGYEINQYGVIRRKWKLGT